MLAVAETIENLGVQFIVPGWVLLLTAIGAMITTTYAAAKIMHAVVVRPTQKSIARLGDEVRAWMATTDLVAEQGPKWDRGLAELAKAVSALSTVQADIALIREQVTIDHGESLKDRIIELSERHEGRTEAVDQQLNRLDDHLDRQDDAHDEAH